MSKIIRKDLIETDPTEFVRLNSDGDANGCRIWKWGFRSKKGYANMNYNGKNSVNVIRLITDCSDDLHVLHSCDNKKCINPNHLRCGTNKENSRDKCKNGDCSHCPDQSRAGKITWSNRMCRIHQCCHRCYQTKFKNKNRMTEAEYDQYCIDKSK